jgi:tetratricopeptide (TPR) repeat protein/MoxR-like ATPase/predicted RNA-binding protein with PUA-like domain
MFSRSDGSTEAVADHPGASPYIFGLHDPGDWQNIFQDAGKSGWVMFNQVVDKELAAKGNPEFADWTERGFGVLARLVNAPFHAQGRGRGSIPLPEEYEDFSRRCAEFVRNSPGCRTWFIGNEMNIGWHWPLPQGERRAQPITPDQYAACFRQVYAAIKGAQSDAWVIPSAVNPLRKPNGQHEDALRWFRAMVQQIQELDGYDIHAYFPLADGKDEDKAYPFAQFLELIPPERQGLPVFITESTPPMPWPKESDGWIQRTYAEVNRWNHNPGHQAIYALLPYHWGQESSADYWSLADKPSYRDDLRQAVQYDYRWRIDPDRRFGDPVGQAEALRRITLVEPEGDLPLFNVPAEAYIYVTDTDLKFGLWESGRILAYASAHPFGGEKGGLLDRFRSASRSSESASELIQNIEKLAPVPLGQAAAMDASVFGARHLIVTPVREADKAATGTEDSIATGLEAALTLADRLGDVQRIAVPAIATDELDAARAAKTVLSTVVAYLEKGSRLQEVAIAPDTADQYRAYQDAFISLSSGEPPSEPQFWLVTALPENWAKVFQAGKVAWTEVRGAKAQQNLQQTRTGDIVLAYRSTPDKFIAGLGHILREPYPYQDRQAVDIQIDLTWDQGVTLDELRQAVPNLEQITNARLSFSRVEPAEWAVIRELIRFHNPGLAPDALPASTVPPQHRAEIEQVTIPDDIQAGETVPVRLSLRNRGNVTWTAGEQLHIACHWWPATEGQAEQPATTWDWTPQLDEPVPPGGMVELTNLEAKIAPTAGPYEAHLTASGMGWEEDTTAQGIAVAQASLTRTVATPPTPLPPTEFEPGTGTDLSAQVRQAIDANQLDQALSLARSIAETEARGRALEDVVRALAQAGQLDLALETARQIENVKARIYALDLLTDYLTGTQGRGLLSEAQSAFEETLSAAQAQDDAGGQVQTLLQIGRIHQRLSDEEGAMDAFHKALSIAQRADDHHDELYIQREIGTSYLRLKQPERALAAFQEALAIAQKLGDQYQVMNALNDIGTAYHDLQDDDRALDSYHQALRIAQESGDESAQSMVLFSLTSLVRDLAGREGAADHYRQALQIVQESGNAALQIELLDAVSSAYGNQRELRQALDFAQQALKLAEETGDRMWQGRMLERLASICHDQGEYKRALDYGQQMLTLARETADARLEAHAQESIGSAYYGASDYVNALDAYQQALALWQKTGDRPQEAGAYQQIGAVHGDMADFEGAQTAYQQALAIRREAGDLADQLWILADLGQICRERFDHSRALEYYQQALEIAQQQEDRQQIATIQERLADVYRDLGDEDQAQAHDGQALDAYQEQLREAQSAGDRAQEAEALSSIGQVHRSMADYEAAQQAYRQALAIRRETGDCQHEAWTLADLGNLARDQKDPQQALSHYQQALTIAQDAASRDQEASLLSSLGSVHHQLANDEEASRALQQALTTHQEMGDRGGEVWALGDLGNLARDRHDPEQALARYQQALAITQETGDRKGEASMLSHLASVQRDLSSYEQALALYQQTLAVQQQIGDRRAEAWTQVDLGDLWHAQSDPQQASSSYQRALEIAQQIQDRDLEATAHERFGAVYRDGKDYERALAAYQWALSLRQGQRNRIWRMWLLDDLGSVYVDQADFQQALDHYQQALAIAREIGERQWEATELYHLGTVYRSLDRVAEAAERFRQSLEIYEQLGLEEDIQRLQNELRTLPAPPTLPPIEQEIEERRPAYQASISLLEPPPDTFWPGEATEPGLPKLEVHNLGTRDWATEGEGEVLLDYTISADMPGFDPIGEMLPLPKPVPAGGSVVMAAPFTVSATAGEYQIRWGLSYSPGGPGSGYEALPLVDRPAGIFQVMSLDEGRKWLDEALTAPSPQERQRHLARIESVLQTGPEQDVRQVLVEEGLFRGLFDADWTVGRTALYALYQARRWYDGLDAWLEAQFASDKTDLAPVRELATKYLRRDEKAWLQKLLVPERWAMKIYRVEAPDDVVAGERAEASLVLHNTGNTTWSAGDEFTIECHFEVPPPGRTETLWNRWDPHIRSDLAADGMVRFGKLDLDTAIEPNGYNLRWVVHSTTHPNELQSAEQVGSVHIAARYAIEIERIEPTAVLAGQAFHPVLHLRNKGRATWQANERVMGTLGWEPPEGITLPDSGLGFSPHPFDAEIGPDQTVQITLPEIEAPPEPGIYQFRCYVQAMDWEAEARRTIDIDITLPTVEYDGALGFQDQPPTEAWPGEKIQVEFLVENNGTEPWPATGATAIQLLYRLGSQVQVHRLPAIAAGETAPYTASYTLPDDPGDYELTWRLLQGGDATGQNGSPLGQALKAKLTVLDLAEMELPTLLGKDATGLAPEVRGRRLAEIGRRLQADTTMNEAQRQEIVENEMAPALFSSSAAVRAAALQALHDLSAQNPEIDKVLHDSLDKPEKELDPLASAAATVSAQLKDWLDGYLPEALHTATPPPIIVPAQPQARKTEAVSLSIQPDEIVLQYDGKTFQSKNLLDDAALSQARADRKPPRLYGELLFDGLFNHDQTGGSGSTYDGYVKLEDGSNWHLELQIDPAVPAYRWEYLCNKYDQTAQPLSVSQQRPLFRRIENNHPLAAAPADPLRVMAAICNPITLRETPREDADDLIAALARLDVDQERAILQSGLQRLQETGLANYEILESQTTGIPVTLDALVRELKNGGYHVLHMLAHGLLHNNIFWLVMEDENRKHKVVRAEEFESALTDYGLRLVVLDSCQSALPGQAGGTFPGLGALLVKQGIPAVVAMQDNVSVESAQIFTQRFYDDLARTGRIDTAMAATRYDLYRYNRRRWDWGIPVLFMNSWDGHLFAVKDERLQQAPPPPKFEDLDIKSYDELPGEGDPTTRALAGAVQAQVRAVRDDPAMLTAVRSLIAAQTGQVSARKALPLAREQERDALDELAHTMQIDARDLAHYVKSETEMEIPLEVYQQVASALNAGKHVVLTGAPGTGKTSLSHAICQYACQPRPDAEGKPRRLCAGMAFTTATADWTTFDTIGGYVPTEQQTLEFRPGIFLEAVANGHWLVIDEINRAEIDKAFGELFTVLSGQRVDLPYKVENVPVRILPAASRPKGQEPEPLYWARHARTGYDYVMTPSWRIIGTMNVYDKSYLFNMSFAFMRRFAFVDIDLPEAPLYHSLVRRWFDKNGLPVQDNAADDPDGLKELTETLHNLIQPKTPLMTRRALGPAIIKDMAEYIGDRYTQDGKQDERLLCYLGEAFQLYALPQLDGLDHEGVLNVYAHINHIFRGLERYHEERPHMLPLLLARIGLLYPHIQADEWDRALQEWKKEHPEAEAAGGPIVEGGTSDQ